MKRNQLLRICNRVPAAVDNGWIHIVPMGELPNAAAGIVQVLDDQAMDAILAGIDKDKNRLGDNWPGIYGGREHFIYDADKDSAALAWFKEFEKRPNGIWARADGLTPSGQAAVANREYKYTSFVSDPSGLEQVGGNQYRVLKIETVGFTNYANGKELLTPITNRSGKKAPVPADGCCPEGHGKLVPDDDGDGDLVCPACHTHFAGSGETVEANQAKNRHHMKNITKVLGLADEASEDAILSAVTRLKNRLTELEPLAEENRQLKNRHAQFNAEQVDGLLAARKITDEKVLNRLRPVLTGLASQEERTAFLDDCGFKMETAAATRVLNRGTGTIREAAPAGDDQARAEKIKNRANELKGAAPARSFNDCWQQATRDLSH